jgi:hypothetical protein
MTVQAQHRADVSDAHRTGVDRHPIAIAGQPRAVNRRFSLASTLAHRQRRRDRLARVLAVRDRR